MTEETPFVAFDNETLSNSEWVEAGDSIQCPHCKEQHELFCVTSSDGKPTDLLLFYKCGDSAYLGALANRCVVSCFPNNE